jgi:hypothetical protein
MSKAENGSTANVRSIPSGFGHQWRASIPSEEALTDLQRRATELEQALVGAETPAALDQTIMEIVKFDSSPEGEAKKIELLGRSVGLALGMGDAGLTRFALKQTIDTARRFERRNYEFGF